MLTPPDHLGERRQPRQQIGACVSRAGASVRSAARSLAERARGLAAISASSAATGRLVSMRKLGGGRLASGAWREPALRPAALGEERLDDAVFERMERHHDQPPARPEHALGGDERAPARPVPR